MLINTPLDFVHFSFFLGGGGGRLFEAGRLLTFPTYRVGTFSRWALIRGWTLNQKKYGTLDTGRQLCILLFRDNPKN